MNIKVVGFYHDGGDGGGTFNVYRDRAHYIETRMAAEAKSRKFYLEKRFKDHSKN